MDMKMPHDLFKFTPADKMASSPRSGRRRVAQGKASDFWRATPWVIIYPRGVELYFGILFPWQGGRRCPPAPRLRLLLLARCALGYFFMALQAVFIKAKYRLAPDSGRWRRNGAKWRLCASVSLWLILWSSPAEIGHGQQWRQALPGYQFNFPRDHASHPEYKIEWWYYTGNLKSTAGEPFGFQFTFFRVGVDPKPENPSRWAIRDLFITHLAVTNIKKHSFQFAEKINRAGIGWAGAAVDTYRVWNEGWVSRLDETGHHRLTALDAKLGIDLELEPGKPPVIHGSDGISQKGIQPGNASHYYSLTRMPTRGTLISHGIRYSVEGLSWMDHEFGTSFLEVGQLGWDWFSIQLDDETDLMLFQLRRSDGMPDTHSSGTLISSAGERQPIGSAEFQLHPVSIWTSPHSGAKYPIEWQISIPMLGLHLTVSTAVADQELQTKDSTAVTYWEGSAEAAGTLYRRKVQGRGYLEMTGYTGKPMSEILH